jgi:hypothetical protein
LTFFELTGASTASTRRSACHTNTTNDENDADLLGLSELIEVEDELQNRFKIFATRRPSELRKVSGLLERRYAWRGYSVQPLAHTYRRVTLSAQRDAATVATITAGVDGADGLFVENLYPDCVEAIRRRGGKLCEFTKFAVDESVRSQALLGAIFHVACMYVLEVHRCTDALIEVNPRHVRFYEQMLGFSRAAEQRVDHSVSAPAVLMRLDLRHCEREIERLAGSGASSRRERSFYSHGLSRPVAKEVVERLRLH